MPSQVKLMEESRYGATMRLGAYSAILKDGTKTLELYRKTGRLEKDQLEIEKLKKDKENNFRLGKLEKEKNTILERHRHRYEVNPKFIKAIEDKGLVFSGYHNRDGTRLMEFIELPQNDFHIATQAHPEFKSSLLDPAPLFLGFVKACIKTA